MTESASPADRLAAARIIGEVRAASLQRALAILLSDSDVQVRRAALEAAGQMVQPVLLAMVLEAVTEPATRAAATRALITAGEVALPGIAATLNSSDLPPETARRLIRVVGRQPGAKATKLLQAQLATTGGDRRHHALTALTQRNYRVEDGERALIEQGLVTEIAEAARLLAALGDVEPRLTHLPAEHPYRLDAALLDAVNGCRERMFLWLALLYDSEAVLRARDSLWPATPETHAQALEMLDTLIPQRLKPSVFALAENLSPAERLRRLGALFTPMRVSAENRLHEIALSQTGLYSHWVRTCALYALAQTSPLEVAPLIRLAQSNDSPLLREMALWTLAQADPRAYRDQYHAEHGGHMLSLIEKVIILKSVSIFAETPPSVLTEVARLLEEVELAPSQLLFAKGEPGRSLYLIVQGRVRVHDGDHTVKVLGPRTIVGEMAVLDLEPRLASVTALEDTLLLRLDQEALYELMSDRVEVARGIIRVLSGRLRNTVAELTHARQEMAEG